MPMNVILLERVPKLGQMGDVVKVKPGFARNFLLPQKKALRATKDNITYFESQRKTLEAQNLERRGEAEAVGNKMSDRPNESKYARSWVLRECEASLKRLATDTIDIYYMHRDFNGMDLGEAMHAIEQLLRDGKIRNWGISNFRGWRIAEMMHLATQLNMPGPVVCQPYYNLLNRQPEMDVLPACLHYGIGVVPYSPVARGVLTGKYAPGNETNATIDPNSRVGRGDKRMMETEFREESLAIAQRLKIYCEKDNRQLAHFATAWVLANKVVSSVIAGPRTHAQWQDYFASVDTVISSADEAFMNSLVSPGHPSTPGYNDPAYPLNGRIVG